MLRLTERCVAITERRETVVGYDCGPCLVAKLEAEAMKEMTRKRDEEKGVGRKEGEGSAGGETA
jgi:hypothetical protein